MEQEIREAKQRMQIEIWRNDNEEQYYGLTKEEVKDILFEFDECLSQIADQQALKEKSEKEVYDLKDRIDSMKGHISRLQDERDSLQEERNHLLAANDEYQEKLRFEGDAI